MHEAQIIIPTLNAGNNFIDLLNSIKIQKDVKLKVLIIDSESDDQTTQIAKSYMCEVKDIKRIEFNHGKTRQLGVEMSNDSDFIIFLTQDVILADENAIKNILNCFENKKIGCAYGQQLPHFDASILASHARIFNYPNKNCIKTIKDTKKMRIKTIFNSDSFAAYRKSALNEICGFPDDVILGEDTYVAAKMILNNWNVFYCADAKVYHSHNYSIWIESKRYFDIGKFHAQEKWLLDRFGKAEGEGSKFVLSEIKYIIKKKKYHLIIMSITRNIFKYLFYKLGYWKETF